jgi:DNA polymerase I-like protein with 3'-5' exonuclease and polymerase domains
MFVASEGHVLLSSDFSQQEPKCLAALCRKDGDSQMYDTFMQGKDLYSEIASKAFNKPYDECREFNPDGSTNNEGKERRTQAKSILLGVLYGRGTASIGEQLHCTTEKAEAIKNSVFRGFPAIKRFEQESLAFAEDYGYVTTVCGRKRRLPDLMLPEYEFRWTDAPKSVDALDFDSADDEVPIELQKKYIRMLRQARFGQKRKIFEEANKKDGIWVIDNGAKIADATRQCVNSRIQGSAADLTKLAMIDLYNNKELKELGFKLLIPVHDEVIAECPIENVKECSTLLAQVMSKAAEKILEMPIKCDVTITREWYGEEIKHE